MLRALLKTMRPRQWTKNIIVFAALVFDQQFFNLDAFLRTTAGFILFCLISSAVYIFNDLADIESDRQHPDKKNRPIASGKLPLPVAWTAGIALVVISLPLGYMLSPEFFAVLLVYFLLIVAYSLWLKHFPILDVLIIAAGFVLRVHAGVTLITVERFSPWLYVVTTLVRALPRLRQTPLGTGTAGTRRRRASQGAGRLHPAAARPVHHHRLGHHHRGVLALHLLRAQPARQSHHDVDHPLCHVRHLPLPLPDPGDACGGAPEEVLLSDRPLQATVVLWGLAVMAVFYLT